MESAAIYSAGWSKRASGCVFTSPLAASGIPTSCAVSPNAPPTLSFSPGTSSRTEPANMNCEIIAIGSELLTPYRSDTNSLFLTERLNKLGVQVDFKTIVGDRQRDLVDAVRIALGRADIVITMGGLGPTVDDLTREAVAEALGFKLKRDQAIVGALYVRFAARRVTMTENN